MRSSQNAFHIAIPCRDLDMAERFYAGRLGCRVGRRRPDRITFDFFGDQLVCHLSPDDIDETPEMYPRHFGITFHSGRSLTHWRKEQDRPVPFSFVNYL